MAAKSLTLSVVDCRDEPTEALTRDALGIVFSRLKVGSENPAGVVIQQIKLEAMTYSDAKTVTEDNKATDPATLVRGLVKIADSLSGEARQQMLATIEDLLAVLWLAGYRYALAHPLANASS